MRICAVSRPSYIFTSESVSEGHPDKVCDRVSDTIVDLFLSKDPEARVACETLTTTNQIILAGEVRCAADIDDDEIEHAAREAVRDIGYEQDGFHWKNSNFQNFLHEQSAHIAQGVDSGDDKDEGAGDQGIMFGYASDETPELMPAPILYSHKILKRMAELRKSGERPEFEPDAKSQVTMRYENGVPAGVTSVVVSTQHREGVSQDQIRELVRPVVTEMLPDGWTPPEEEFYVNPTGNFVIGGPDGDAGLTGRKIIVDTYGGSAPHGGGAFSGKDPTKVDRSAAYACRYLAKNVVAAGLAKRCTIQVSYAIGVSKPLSLYVDCHGTNEVDEVKLEDALRQLVDLSPRGIRTHLQLNRPIYARTAAYGHFGRKPDNEGGFSWEKTDIADELRGLA
jgi:S-adenosylmethionine synthetase